MSLLFLILTKHLLTSFGELYSGGIKYLTSESNEYIFRTKLLFISNIMPNFDKTGPAGEGVATGRGLGPCSNNQQGNPMGRGRRCCGNRGRFFQNRKGECSLDDQEKMLEKRLEEVRAAKKELNSENNV